MTAQLHPRCFCHRDRRSSPRSASASRVLSVKDDAVRGSGTKSQRRGRRRQRYHHRKDVCRCVFYLGLLTREYLCLKALPQIIISNDFLLRDGHVWNHTVCSLPLSFAFLLFDVCFVNFFFQSPLRVSSPPEQSATHAALLFSFSISARREERKRDPIERESEALVVSSSRRIEIVYEKKRDEIKKRREAPLSLSL
jgi:hypothetical protein